MDKADVAAIAVLARLSFSAEEEEKMREHMKKVTQLCSVLDDIESVGDDCYTVPGELREDTPAGFADTDRIISGAPSSNERYISVPRVVGGNE